jgi:hypothetical protein
VLFLSTLNFEVQCFSLFGFIVISKLFSLSVPAVTEYLYTFLINID